jgi:hypothetical protein
MVPIIRDHLFCIFIHKYTILASSKYPSFNKTKNPFVKNVRTQPSSYKKSSVMFDENNEGINAGGEIEDDYYELTNDGYYTIENNQPYYRIGGKQIWSVNYIKNGKIWR